MVQQQGSSGGPHSVPPDDERMGLSQWLWAEAKFHLFPWGEGFLLQKPAIIAAGIGLSIAVTIAWLLTATGRMAPAVVIAWWIGWSIYEYICRMNCKPWIKEGVWWGRKYRRASAPDMIAYITTKNLLIGAGLFLVLYLLGALPGHN